MKREFEYFFFEHFDADKEAGPRVDRLRCIE